MKKGCFAIGLTTKFLSYIGHLQLTVFICCECYQTSYKSCKNYNSLYIWCNSLQLKCNFQNSSFSTTMQFPYDYNHNVMHFSSIHQNLTHGTMRIFHEFFEILISIVHYDYSFRWFWMMTCGTIKSCHMAY
jgi:hypothetical protein